MPGPLDGELALVTGSSRGLGRAIALRLHAEGAAIVLNHVDPARTLAVEGVRAEVNGLVVRADVTDPSAVARLFDTAQEHFQRPISVVVNNALPPYKFNGESRTPLTQLSWQEMDHQIQGAVRAALHTTQAALPGFAKLGRGRIINIGSNLVQNPVVPYHDYIAAKAGLLAFTRTCAAELGPRNVTVNMVVGGLLRQTDASAATPEAVFDQIAATTPLRRATEPDDVAGAVCFFASPWARSVTGQQLIVDGGLVMN